MEVVDLSDSQGEEKTSLEGVRQLNSGTSSAFMDPKLCIELEDELLIIDSELERIQADIEKLLEEQDKYEARRSEISQILQSAVTEPHGKASEARQASSGLEECVQQWQKPFEWDSEVNEIRLNLFGLAGFRQHQKEIINAVLAGRDVFVVMPAGGGKSLCYQLPAMLRPGICLVVSPLLSLMQDQVMGLRASGISAAMLTSATDKEEEKRVHAAVEKGIGELKLLYVTPEKIARSKRFVAKLEKCYAAGRLSLLAIDEAHCCSQWGHDFRPDYKSLNILKKQFPRVPLLALTATATERVQMDVREMLHMKRCEKFVSSVNRPNLYYEVREKKSNASGVIQDIIEFIRTHYTPKDSGIIYCFSRRECEQVAGELVVGGIGAAYYHADMDAGERADVHRRWSNNRLQLIVATIAFGMGINKPDVRFVIHHTLSKSIETYYQESGRAGRDGLPARCLLYFRCADVARQSSMVFAEAAGLQNLYAIVRFCHYRHTCRRAAIFAHFGESQQKCDGMCDVCAEPRGSSSSSSSSCERSDVSEEAQSMIRAVCDLSGPKNEAKITMLQLFDAWRKAYPQWVRAQHAKKMGREVSERLMVELLLEGGLREEFKHTAYSTNSYVVLGHAAPHILDARKRIYLYLDRNLPSPPSTTPMPRQGKGKGEKVSGSGGMMMMSVVQKAAERELDELRTQIALERSIFPHAVLSSQHLSSLAAAAAMPSSRLLEEEVGQQQQHIQSIIGKRKWAEYGERVMNVLHAVREEANNNNNNNKDHHSVGEWVTTKSGTNNNNSSSMAPAACVRGGHGKGCRNENENVVFEEDVSDNDGGDGGGAAENEQQREQQGMTSLSKSWERATQPQDSTQKRRKKTTECEE